MQFSNKTYDTLKWICLVAIPAANTFIGILLPTLEVSPTITTKVVTIIAALGAFLGTLIGISNASYYAGGKEEKDE